MPDGEVVVQDVLADKTAGCKPSRKLFGGDLGRASDVGLWLEMQGASVVVGRLPESAAYPRPRG